MVFDDPSSEINQQGLRHATSRLSTDCSNINQSKLKQTYSSIYVQQVYRERGFQELEEALNKYLSSDGWNAELKKNCLEKLIRNLQRANNLDSVLETYSDYMDVCASIKLFVAGLE